MNLPPAKRKKISAALCGVSLAAWWGLPNAGGTDDFKSWTIGTIMGSALILTLIHNKRPAPFGITIAFTSVAVVALLILTAREGLGLRFYSTAAVAAIFMTAQWGYLKGGAFDTRTEH